MNIAPMLPWWVLAPLSVVLLGGIMYGWFKKLDTTSRRVWRYRFMLIALLLVMVWRPQFYYGGTQQRSTLLDVYFVIDTTQSMVAEDYNGSEPRMHGVQNDVKALIAQLPGAQYSVITFDNEASSILPLTTDATAAQTAVNALQVVNYTYATGSSISEPVDLLKNELATDQKNRPQRQRVVFYFGDGEQTSKANIASFSPIAPYIVGGGVLGYGTTAGGRMVEQNYHYTGGYKSDYKSYVQIEGKQNDYSAYTDALSKIDEDTLKTIATQMHAPYFHRTTPSDDKVLTSTIAPTSQAPAEHNKDVVTSFDFSWLWALMMLMVVALDTRGQLDARITKMARKGKL